MDVFPAPGLVTYSRDLVCSHFYPHTLLLWGTVEAGWMLTGDNLVLVSLTLSFLTWAAWMSMPRWQSYSEASMGNLLLWWSVFVPLHRREEMRKGGRHYSSECGPFRMDSLFHLQPPCRQNRPLSTRLLTSGLFLSWFRMGEAGWASLSWWRNGWVGSETAMENQPFWNINGFASGLSLSHTYYGVWLRNPAVFW